MTFSNSEVLVTHMQQRKEYMQSKFVCRFCHKTFVIESRYLNHKCKQMKREEELKSPTGQAALNFYQLWMRQMKRMAPPAGSFIASKYFRTFINFTTFAKAVNLPRPEKFIWLMVEKDYPPTLWTNDEIYVMYLEFLDRKIPPMEQAKHSIDTLLDFADKHEIDVSCVFDVLQPNDVIHMLRTRKLSPWLLLFSKKFGNFYVNKTTPEQKIIMESLIQPSYWEQKKENYPAAVIDIEKCVSELNI